MYLTEYYLPLWSKARYIHGDPLVNSTLQLWTDDEARLQLREDDEARDFEALAAEWEALERSQR